MAAILLTDSWIETGGCDGPRDIRKQPSREMPGTTMTEIQDKYIPEFELPYRNMQRYIKEVNNNWNRLDNGQKQSIKNSFSNMGFCKENFANVDNSDSETPSASTAVDFMEYLGKNPIDGPKKLLDLIYNPTEKQKTELQAKGVDEETLSEIKHSIKTWSLNNSLEMHANWASGTVLFVLFFIIIILIVLMSMDTGRNSESLGKAFGFLKTRHA